MKKLTHLVMNDNEFGKEVYANIVKTMALKEIDFVKVDGRKQRGEIMIDEVLKEVGLENILGF